MGKESVYKGDSIEDVLTQTTEYTGDLPDATGRSSREVMRSYILEASQDSHLAPMVYRDMLRASIASFGTLHYVDGDGKTKRVLSEHANAERTISKKFKENTIVLPLITVGQSGSSSDDRKQRYDNVLIQTRTWNEDTQRAERIIKFADVPVKVDYKVNVWTKYMSDMDQLTELIRLKFNPGVVLKTKFSDSIKAFLTNEAAVGQLEVADKQDRIIRKSFTISAELFIPSPSFKVTSTGRVEKIVSEFWVS